MCLCPGPFFPPSAPDIFYRGKVMTRCEQLHKKLSLLQEAARNTTGSMRNIWLAHIYKLKQKITLLSIKELKEEV